MRKNSGKKSSPNSPRIAKEKYLGDHVISPHKFEDLGKHLREFKSSAFQRLSDKLRIEQVNRALHQLIESAKSPCFLLPAVIDYIEQINALKIVDSYAFLHFELWLNQFSHLTEEQNYAVRAKVAGKGIPRDEYQTLFPIGMGKIYPGSHFVTAHGSPDLDTTVASFWGWIDAFAAKVAEGLHVWNVPGGPPTSQVEVGLLFNQIFGDGVFEALTKTRTSLSMSGIELMTQKGLVRKQTSESTLKIDLERMQNAIILVDKDGYYLGDWRTIDGEGVRQVIMHLNNCLRWFEVHLHVKLISLFAKDKLSLKDLPSFVNTVSLVKLADCQPAKDLSEKQRKHLQDYLTKVLKVKKGFDCTLEEFAKGMKALSLFDFQEFVDLVESMHKSSLFDKSGTLIENRPRIFNYLERIIKALDSAIQSVRNFVERLDVALSIKTEVFGYNPQYVSYRADVDEIKSKMGTYPYLSVVSNESNGKLVPLGIIHAHDLHRNILGTVSLRDFCNREETKIPSFLEVISVMDHHKSSLHTTSAPIALIADSQSTNVLCAEAAFEINDHFGTAGMSKEQIDAQISELSRDLTSLKNKRLMKRLLQKQLTLHGKQHFYIDPAREFIEYLHFFYAILDDTDLLTKVSQRDVECVAHLINRLKSLMLKRETEVLSLSDIPRDTNFVQKAAARILQNPDVYSLYKKIYLAKEDAIEKNILLCAKGQPSPIFVDTKEQNGCARVGQSKMFSRNFPIFFKNVEAIRKCWLDNTHDFYRDRPEVDLYMHMISTVAGAEDLFSGREGKYEHSDELWIWIPFTEQSIQHLKGFLNAFRASPQLTKDGLSAQVYGEKAKEYEQIFKESFLPVSTKLITGKGTLPIAVLKYRAGAINSRKAMISPYLPKLVE